jgi:hypothetical protein
LSITPSAPFSKRSTTTAVSMSPIAANTGSETAAPCAVTSVTSPASQRAVSRSWIVQSTKNPPDPARYSIFGGAMSRSDVRNR